VIASRSLRLRCHSVIKEFTKFIANKKIQDGAFRSNRARQLHVFEVEVLSFLNYKILVYEKDICSL